MIQELENLITSSINFLRIDEGISSSVHYTEALSWILFLKFLNDKEKENLYQAELNFEEYPYLLDEKYQWDNWATSKNLTGEELILFINNELFPYLASLKGGHDADRIEVICSIFKEVTNRVQSGYLLKDVLLRIDQIDFNSSENLLMMSHLYESLLQQMGDDIGDSCKFYTPRPVIRFIVDMINPEIGKTVYCPACGSAGFLVQAYKYMKQFADISEKVKTLEEKTFYGQEKTSVAYLLGVLNKLLHGINYPKICKTNTLHQNIREIDESQRYDYILATPPFGEKEQPFIQKNFPVEAKVTELLFLQYMMKSLKIGGKAAVVLPEGVVFRTNSAYKTVKEELLNNFNVHSVVSLPAGVFLPYSTVKTSIIFFDRTTPTKEVWFYDVPILGGKKLTKNNRISKEHLDAARELFIDRVSNKNSCLVPIEEIIKKDYNLSASKYIPNKIEEEELLDPEEYVEEIYEHLLSATQSIQSLMTGEESDE